MGSLNAMKEIWSEEIGRISLTPPVVLPESTPVAEVIQIMQKKKRGSVLLTDEAGKLTGIFTERDVLDKFIGTPLPGSAPVSEAMTRDVATLPPDITLSKAIEHFGKTNHRFVPIVGEDHKIYGLLTIRVIVTYLAEHLPAEVLNIPPDSRVFFNIEGG